MSQASMSAGGNIKVSTFVKVGTVSDTVLQATAASDKPFGISGEYSNTAAIPGADTSLHAASGQPCLVYQDGDVCYLQVGSAGWSAGNLLASNATGQGVSASSSEYFGAEALHDATGNTLGRVKIRFGKL